MIRNFLFSIFFYFGIILICIIFLPAFFLPQKIVLLGGKMMGHWSRFCLELFLSTKIMQNEFADPSQHPLGPPDPEGRDKENPRPEPSPGKINLYKTAVKVIGYFFNTSRLIRVLSLEHSI